MVEEFFMKTTTRFAVPALVTWAVLIALPLEGQTLRTPAEEAGYGRYTQHADVARFLEALDRNSKEVSARPVGRTLEVQAFGAATLYLCILSREGVDRPEALNRSKPTVFIFAAQHGNEQSGKEAALALIRDLAVGELNSMLDSLNLLVIPQSNPYGNSVDRRTNEQNLDLNRDHVKLEAPETRIIHKVFLEWMPEVTLDVHEKGDDYYRVSTGCVSNLNIHSSLQEFSRGTLFPLVRRRVEADGFTWHEYLVTDSPGSGRSSGAASRVGTGRSGDVIVRYSTPDLNDGRNGPGIYETLSFIQEGASRHDLATLEARTRWQYSGILGLVEAVKSNAAKVNSLVRTRRKELIRTARKMGSSNVVHLRMEYVRDPKNPELPLKRFERGAGTEQKVVDEVVTNWLPVVESRLSVPRAPGYLVPAALTAVVRTLQDHGIKFVALPRDTALEAEAYRVKELAPAAEDYLPPAKMVVERGRIRFSAKAGDYYVPGDQPAANLIPGLLEPESEFGLIRYRAYGLVPAPGAEFPVVRTVKALRLSTPPSNR
jgi:hypothetical protein